MTNPPSSAMRCTENFYIKRDAIEDINGFFRLSNYGKGPDPIREIERSDCPIQECLSCACLSVRQALVSYLNKGVPVGSNDWPSVFTYENLAGQSLIISGWVKDHFNNNRNDYPKVNLTIYNVCDVFSSCRDIEHTFQIVKTKDQFFIVDLSIRQFIDGCLALKDEEAVVIDALLKDGYVEVSDGVLDIYYSFFDSYSKHKERQKGHFNNYKEWYLYNSKIPDDCLRVLWS